MSIKVNGIMEVLTFKEILNATKGRVSSLTSSYENIVIKGISTDSRKVKEGDLFIALKGSRFDGHNFIMDAFKKKALAAVASRNVGINKPIIKVKDTLRALGDIAAYYRNKFNSVVVGVTGSNGKTTTKNMIGHILSYKFNVISSYSSFNNFVGVPLTIFRMSNNTDILVQEMETNVLGGIRKLSRIVKPSVGVITNIGPTHLESLKTEYNVFREKSELIKYLPLDGISVINRDDKFFMKLKGQSSAKSIITFGIKKNADFRANNIKLTKEGIYFNVGRIKFFLPTLFYKNVYNALAAISVSKGVFGVSLRQAAMLLRNFEFPALRAQLIKLRNLLIINDCFNANPQSMEDALLMLASFGGENKIAVLGDMFELGRFSDKFHYRIGEICASLNLSVLIAYGRKARFIAKGAKDNGLNIATYCKTHKDVVKSIIENITPFSIVLVKGSRAMQMEGIVRELLRKLKELTGKHTGII